MNDTTAPPPATALDLEIDGMTCASCATRIERKLNKLDGVHASVNYALEHARVEVPPGTDPQAIVAAVEAAGYQARIAPIAGRDADEPAPTEALDPVTLLGRKVIAVAALGVPVIALGMVPALQFTNWQWLSLMLSFPIVTWGASSFHRAAWANLRHGTSTMDTLVSLGVTAAFLWSFGALFLGDAGEPGLRHGFQWTAEREHASSAIYLEVVAATTLFLLMGRWFEARARRRGGNALRALADLGAKDVHRLGPDGREVVVPIEELRIGDRFVVRPGEKVATDGVVVEGSSAIDAALVTGESVPVEVGPGDAVTGATINAGGRLVVEASSVGADTVLARMVQLVADAQSGKAEVQRLADRVAGVFVPVVLLIAAGTFGYWLGAGEGFAAALSPAVAVLIVACPCALGLATPTALLVGTGRGAQLGVLIRGPEVLEMTRRVDTVVLDKTGTLTVGHMAVVDVATGDGVDEQRALQLAASVEAASEHPIARAIAATVPPEERLPVSSFTAAAGLGVEGDVDGEHVVAGRAGFLADGGFGVPPDLDAARLDAEQAGRTAVFIGWGGTARLVVVVADTVRPDAGAAIAGLRSLGMEPVMVTGDNAAAAHAVADQLGIERVVSEVLPAGKVDVVKQLQDDGRVVAVVGDGVNDAAALAQADLGLAMGSGTDVAREAADLTLVRGDLTAAVDAVRLSRRTLRTIKGNLVWAFGYNVAALPVAAAGLLHPMLAGLAMAASSVFVVSNSLRLFRFRSVAR